MTRGMKGICPFPFPTQNPQTKGVRYPTKEGRELKALGNQERKEQHSLKPKCQDTRRRKTTITGPSLATPENPSAKEQSKPGERHSYIPQARDKGEERAESRERNKKNFPRAGIFFFIIRTRLPKQILLLSPEQQLKEKRPMTLFPSLKNRTKGMERKMTELLQIGIALFYQRTPQDKVVVQGHSAYQRQWPSPTSKTADSSY